MYTLKWVLSDIDNFLSSQFSWFINRKKKIPPFLPCDFSLFNSRRSSILFSLHANLPLSIKEDFWKNLLQLFNAVRYLLWTLKADSTVGWKKREIITVHGTYAANVQHYEWSCVRKIILKCRHESVSMRPAQSFIKTPSETGADNLLLWNHFRYQLIIDPWVHLIY